jgi:hypothetical protein
MPLRGDMIGVELASRIYRSRRLQDQEDYKTKKIRKEGQSYAIWSILFECLKSDGGRDRMSPKTG